MFRRFNSRDRQPLSADAAMFSLVQCRPTLPLEGLRLGVDNLRYDVVLSSRFIESSRQFISRVLARHGNAGELAEVRERRGAPPRIFNETEAKAVPDFKPALVELLTGALQRAKHEQSPSVDLLARIAVAKLLRQELGLQYAGLVERCRARMAQFDGPHADATRRAELRERFAQLQAGKRTLLRRAGEETYQVLREVEKETLARMRRAIFAEAPAEPYDILLNRLLFTENGHDDFIAAEHYCMLGHYERDCDRPSNMRDAGVDLLRELTGDADREALLAMSCAPENAQELVAAGAPDASTTKGQAQQRVLEEWHRRLQRQEAMRPVLAAYAAAPLLVAYGAKLNPQQLKAGLIDRRERYRIQELMAEHGLDAQPFVEAATRVARTGEAEQMRIAGRFLLDLFRYTRDLRRLEVLNAACERVNLIRNEKLRDLSSVNGTLYEFLLRGECDDAEEQVLGHVVLKADVRDSTTLTQRLVERGLNPASFFSLNFYDPITKLLPKYTASKVFIEGDALILAIFEHAGPARLSVGKACLLAREILDIVHAYNERLRSNRLPRLELGIGICYQDGAPLYLMDGTSRIMISHALNESDRLSSCSKAARARLRPAAGFRVHAAVQENRDDVLRFNVDGIALNAEAVAKLRKEIAVAEHDALDSAASDRYGSRLLTGVVPLGHDVFREITIREGKCALLNAEGENIGWSDSAYYELCGTHAASQPKAEDELAEVAGR